MQKLAGLAAVAIILAVMLVIRFASPGAGDQETMVSAASPPAGVSAAIMESVDSECMSARGGERRLTERLDARGHPEWRVSIGSSAQRADCVSAVALVEERLLRIVPVLRPEVRAALRQLSNEMLDRCLKRNEAVALVRLRLAAVGEADYELRTDGPRTGPANRSDDLARHMEAGCYLYGGILWKTDGTRVYLIGGTLE